MNKKILAIILAIAISATVFSIYFFMFAKNSPSNGITSTIVKVLDGDTIELANGDKIRLLGIDAPEKDQLFYNEIKDQLKQLEGKSVRLERDVTNKDKYGRYLRYVFYNDNFVNLELVENGLVYTFLVSPDVKFKDSFIEAEEYARKNQFGVWKRSLYSDCIELAELHYNAKGNDAENLNDEYVTFVNICNYPVNLKDWELRDRGFNRFVFSEITFNPDSLIRIYSGEGENTENEFYWDNEYPIWNNAADAVYLRDNKGDLILSQAYEN